MRARWFWVLVFIVWAAAACQEEATPVRVPTETLIPLEPSPTFAIRPPTEIPPDAVLPQLPGINNPTAAALPGDADTQPSDAADAVYKPQLVNIALDGDAQLTAELYENPAGARGVLMLAAPFTDWGGLPATLHQEGYAVLVVDGRTPPQSGDFGAAFNALITLGAVSADGVAVIGTEAFADQALIGCSAEPRCSTAVLLSPRDSQAVVSVLGAYGSRPLLAAASLNDEASVRVIEALRAAATGDALIQPLDDAGTGAQMLQRRADLVTLIQTWLSRYTR